ncbi:hypothetical protein TNCV_686821 [Trichonephila clavipes]|nr:hypothetical protein TNCV_686821 [Trichonephila clavipes]
MTEKVLNRELSVKSVTTARNTGISQGFEKHLYSEREKTKAKKGLLLKNDTVTRLDSSFFPITETQEESVPDEIGNVIADVVDFAMQINLEVDSDDAQELRDSHYLELRINELIEMHEQDIEKLQSLNPV